MTTQGQVANRNGRSAEDVIDGILTGKRLLFIRQFRIGTGIYGTPLRTDFYVPHPPRFADGLCIESKWQESGGSADEKYPYLVANIRECFPCPAVVVAGGGGARPEAVAWLRRQVDGIKLMAVFSLEEFLTWCNRNF